MTFADTATVVVRAGDGGPGVVSFRHEKFVDRGGPDGGDGGRGGDVIFIAKDNLNTLADFRHRQELKADSGETGAKRKRHGKSGKHLEVAVPVGTVVKNDDQTIADFTEVGQTAVIARGGDGGYGNAHFTSSRRQAPRVAEKGEPGELAELSLELKLIADVGLIGLPNAGKSTLLSVISNARPEIADYAFTTLSPNLGVADVGKESLLIADIPGLIEGASKGKGLGGEFLRHVERTAVLIHLIDAYSDDVAKDYQTIQAELANYTIDLSSRPQILTLTKIEGFDDELLQDQLSKLKKVAPKQAHIMAISSQAKIGLGDLLKATNKAVKAYRTKEAKTSKSDTNQKKVYTLDAAKDSWRIEQMSKHKFHIRGGKIEKFARRTDFDSEPGVQRLRDIMRKMGIMNELEKRGVSPGDKVEFRGVEDILEI